MVTHVLIYYNNRFSYLGVHAFFQAIFESRYVGAIVCKLDLHKKVSRRGYIAMLAVDETVRRRKIGNYTTFIFLKLA